MVFSPFYLNRGHHTKMNLNHGDTDSPTFPDEERLMKGDYQSLDSEQAKASTRRARKETIDFICTIITRVAGGLIVILLLFILASEHKLVTLEQHHHVESNTSMHAHGEVLKPFVWEDAHKTWKGCGSSVAEARSLGWSLRRHARRLDPRRLLLGRNDGKIHSRRRIQMVPRRSDDNRNATFRSATRRTCEDMDEEILSFCTLQLFVEFTDAGV